jgi:hypothetical protein
MRAVDEHGRQHTKALPDLLQHNFPYGVGLAAGAFDDASYEDLERVAPLIFRALIGVR